MTIHPLASLTKLVTPTQILFGTDFPFLTAKVTAAGLREVGLFDTAELQDRARECGPADAEIQDIGSASGVQIGLRMERTHRNDGHLEQ